MEGQTEKVITHQTECARFVSGCLNPIVNDPQKRKECIYRTSGSPKQAKDG